MRRDQRRPTSRDPTFSRSEPTFSTVESTASTGDFILNPADLLPADDEFEGTTSFFYKIKVIIFSLIKLCFLFILSVNIIGLIIDPTPLLRAHDYLTRPNPNPNPTVNSERTSAPEALKPENEDLKHFSAKLNILRDDLNVLKNKINSVDEWRANLEFEMSKVYRKNLEEMGQYFTEIEHRIAEALSEYDADKIGKIDYALETAGGKVVSTPDTVPYPAAIAWDFGYFQLLTPSSAAQVIQAGNLPGQCFAFHGNMGRIRIRLAEPITITSVTLEHSPFKLLSDISSCPRNFTIVGIENIQDTNGTELGAFTFKNRTALQNFAVNATEKRFQYVDLCILDNYGKEEYTCVYRFRVHGTARTELQ